MHNQAYYCEEAYYIKDLESIFGLMKFMESLIPDALTNQPVNLIPDFQLKKPTIQWNSSTTRRTRLGMVHVLNSSSKLHDCILYYLSLSH
jgi:hypothetical protein